ASPSCSAARVPGRTDRAPGSRNAARASPPAGVDSHTEARIAEGIREVRSGRTTVLFTSSPLLLDRADRVVLILDGEVEAVGVHRELVRTEPRYRAVVTRETDDDADLRGGAFKEKEAALRSGALEEIEESA
ncbi:hypothetical protein AB0D38_43195, partial [Streptomyces sp. NPDC048279]